MVITMRGGTISGKMVALLAARLILAVMPAGLYAQDKAQSAEKPKSPLESFTPELTGFMYYSLDASDGADKANSFDISRVYMGGKFALSDKFTFRYLSDIGHETGGGKFEVFTKYACLDWKFSKSAALTIGLQGTKNFGVEEKEWGFRVIRKAPMESFGDFWGTKTYFAAIDSRVKTLNGGDESDKALAVKLGQQKAAFAWSARNKMGSSADQGVSLSLKPDADSYIDIMVINGDGYKKAEDDKYKNFQFRAGRYLAGKKVHLSAYFEFEPWSYTDSLSGKKSYSNRQWDLMATFSSKDKGLLGLNYNGKTFAGSFEDITASCFSIFGNVNLGRPDTKFLARYDYYSSGFNQTGVLAAGAADLKTNGGLFILGLDYAPTSRVHIVPNVQILDYENSATKTSSLFYIHMLVTL